MNGDQDVYNTAFQEIRCHVFQPQDHDFQKLIFKPVGILQVIKIN